MQPHASLSKPSRKKKKKKIGVKQVVRMLTKMWTAFWGTSRMTAIGKQAIHERGRKNIISYSKAR